MKKEILEIFKENVDINRLMKDEQNINISYKDNSYFISYVEFLKYFKDLNKITIHNMIIGINFTHGWMPTIFDFRSNNFDEVVKILNNTKQGIIPNIDQLEILKKCFNNSLVGSSKILHFINPDKFAIWDSRVFRYLTNKKYGIDNCKYYLDYLKFFEYITNKPEYNKIHESIINKVDYEMTKFRTLELIMYIKGKKNKLNKI
ncbi:TPA: hypothetical protein DIC38_00490 [Candidatus Nomurabacteria bacterium]|nr:MAG: hypothetical protein O210_OD1C00001G0632 [Parcubacteria bacterium RAAC4_OD1_1]HCY26149.1 hypothetical protein [Candidatus Nomurabacteria bacterium]